MYNRKIKKYLVFSVLGITLTIIIIIIVLLQKTAVLPKSVSITHGNVIAKTPSYVKLGASIPAVKPKKLIVKAPVVKPTTRVTKKVLKPKVIKLPTVKKATPRASRGMVDEDVVATLYNFEITFYNNDYSYTNSITKSGVCTVAGRTIAVDPNIIPMGTWVEITFPDGRSYIRKAEDTGGAVKGRVIDIYANQSDSILKERGRTRHATVRILRR